MPHAIALNDHCLANDSSSPWGEENENKIHQQNYSELQIRFQSGQQPHCCHKQQDNGSCTGCCLCHRALYLRHHHHHHHHHRTMPPRAHGACDGDALSMKCTISCTMCANRVRTQNRHHHHRHRHRRRAQEESRSMVCLCTNKRRLGGTSTPGSRPARVQHAHRKSSPSGSCKIENQVDLPVPLTTSLIEIGDKQPEINHEVQANNCPSDQTRHMGGSVIFKVPVASGEKHKQLNEGTNGPELTSISQRPRVTSTGNGQLAQENNNNNEGHLAGQRVHGGREPPQMIRYLGSSMQVRSEQKATRVLGGVFFFFIFCWTPFFFSNFLSGILERDLLSQYIPDSLMTCFLWLGYSSSTVNPIIYTVANRNFRRAFVRLLLCREPVGRRQYRQSRSSEYYKSFRFSQYPTARQPVILDKE